MSKAYPHYPGSGPEGERCGTCGLCCRCRVRSGRRFYKCGMLFDHWTSGPATDIRLKSPACLYWVSGAIIEAWTATPRDIITLRDKRWDEVWADLWPLKGEGDADKRE